MAVIRQEDLIESIADALQFISYYHPLDFIRAMRGAWEREESPSAKAALTQVLVNSRMCALGKRPICQDTGIVNVFITVGMDVSWEADLSLEDMINEGVRSLGLAVRSGLHVGEIEKIDDDISGINVNAAARIQALAKGGQVLVSEVLKSLVFGSGIEFGDFGAHHFKGFDAKWNLYQVKLVKV